MIDAEATAVIGAGPWAHSEDRVAVRNGTRPRGLTTTAGDLELRIPKLRTGTFFPSLLERQRRIDQALFAVVEALSRICADLDSEVAASRDRSLADTTYPYVFLDATYCKARSTTGSCPRPSSSRSG